MSEPSLSAALMRLINGYQVSQALHVVATLGIAELLGGGPRTSQQLAAAAGADPGALYRVLRAVAAVGVFSEGAGQTFSLTPLGECLRSDTPSGLGGWAAFIGRPYYWEAWAHLLHSVRTGENAFHHVHGTDVWGYRSQHAEEGAVFDHAMTALSRDVAEAVVSAYDFSPLGCLVDVGGGQGSLLASILMANPGLRGILFDQPHVVARAEQVLRAAGIVDRCQVVPGDFLKAVPEGADGYVLKAILHDWDDAAAIAILQVCRRVMKPEARLLVLERLIEPPNEGPETKFSDLNMLVAPGGQERTREEFEALFAAAGFRLTKVVTTATRLSVIEGVPT
jgi:precorrin-6B methylase 2